MHGLDAPAALHKFDREPVEQLGMRGRTPRLAEIVERLDEPCPEMMLPDAVDHHPRGEWMLGASQPARKGKPPACLLRARPGRGHFKWSSAVGKRRRDAWANQ